MLQKADTVVTKLYYPKAKGKKDRIYENNDPAAIHDGNTKETKGRACDTMQVI